MRVALSGASTEVGCVMLVNITLAALTHSKISYGSGRPCEYAYRQAPTTTALPKRKSGSASSGKPRAAKTASIMLAEPTHAAASGMSDSDEGSVRVTDGR